ncbi:chemotaxis protein CheA [Aromatoleum toluolicum]|uniref:Chemotaxis protein CheA n=1 Tax=Aromatoleum toluolicum TaxID=90060 RepID=A0ABX1NFB0_9RHOO|nr:chemotaxis protein CheA [Aromatoleum toluolicum]NMF97865.1 chemotaxis protein CheA [Aromatoleum toluolicum]
MDELTSTFVTESRDMLAEMEAGLLRLEQAPDDGDNLNGIFRAAHTIKGGSGVIECHFIENFTHQVENLLDLLRNGRIPVTGELATLLLSCCDQLGALLDTLASGQAEPLAEVLSRGDELTAALRRCVPPDEATEEGGVPAERPPEVRSCGGGVVSTDGWHISVRFGENVLRGGMDPLSFLRYLGTLGEILSLETISDAIPPAEQMDPESCYLGFEIRLQTRASKAEIEHVFEFVRDDCSLRILPPRSKVQDYIQLINELPEDTMRLGEMLLRCGALTPAELDAGLAAQQPPALPAAEGEFDDAQALPAPPIGEVLVEQQVVHREVVEAAASRQAAVSEKKAIESRMVRVQADKLDQLIDLVGELVIAGASANLLAQKSGQVELVESTSVLSRLVENIRDAALQLRMVQIGETFNRFNRVVRDASRELGKDIALVVTGAETELDKSVVEKLGDPLMHLVRNAIDHGIEPAAVRLARGKSKKGRVGLNAYHDSGSIVIEVSDDGSGLSRERIRHKAIEKGLIDESMPLGDDELINLIFEAGFSTAEKVTNISGRGVGMDVVRRNIQALRGTITVSTRDGEGSTFTIRLPLTLAIIDGFLTSVDKSSYVIPLDSVVECIELGAERLDRNYLNLRGEVLPFVNLRELFEIDGEPPSRRSVVVVQYAGSKVGIVIDKLHGEFQTVIKPLGALFRHLRGIGGSTILGSGDVALILDVPALVDIASRRERSVCLTTSAVR